MACKPYSTSATSSYFYSKLMSIAQTLLNLQAQGLPRLDAQRLVLHALGQNDHDRAWLLAHDTQKLTTDAQQTLAAAVARTVAGEPLAYVLGHQGFYGLDLQVDHRALVPRPDTEILVDWALEVLGPIGEPCVIDLGTGSGAIALALKSTRPDLQVTALDYSGDALAVAQGNAERLNLNVQFAPGSWLSSVTTQFHAIVSNPPYIAAQDHHLAALTHEPLAALASGADGLDDIRTIIAQAPTRLLAGGWLLLEHGYDQAPAVRQLLSATGFAQVQSRRDLAGIERCSGGQWTAVQ